MKKYILALILLIIPSLVLAAGSCTTSVDNENGLKIIVFDWTSSAGGAVSGEGTISVTGVILGVLFVPDTDVSDNYDVTIVDSNSMDVIIGVGADQPGSGDMSNNDRIRTPQTTDGANVVLYNTAITPAISNAGNAKHGYIYLILNNN